MKSILFMSILAVSSTLAAEQTPFEAGKYSEAVKAAEEKIASTAPTGEDYYNLALAQEKAGQRTQAALSYQRALLLDPGLSVARNARATLASASGVSLPPHNWKDDVTSIAHPDTLVLAGSLLFWGGVFVFFLAVQGSRPRGVVKAISVVAMILGTASQVTGWLVDGRVAPARPALVTAEGGVDVLTAPASNSTPVVKLPEGTPVGVLSPRGTWTYIDINGDIRGWVQTDRLTPVTPGETLL